MTMGGRGARKCFGNDPAGNCDVGWRVGSLCGQQCSDDGQVGGGEIESREVGGCHPANGDVFVRLGWSAAWREVGDKGNHRNDDGAVVVREARQGAREDEVAAEFLADFAEERGLRCLTGFDLAAGKFPLEGEVLVRGSLGDEHAAGIVLDDGADDGNRGGSHGGQSAERSRKLHAFS